MITSPGKEPSTRKGKKLDKLAVEWSVDPKDFREVDRQAIPIVLISDRGKRIFPTKYQSTQTYTKYKLQLVANLAANCLSESNTIDIRVLVWCYSFIFSTIRFRYLRSSITYMDYEKTQTVGVS